MVAGRLVLTPPNVNGWEVQGSDQTEWLVDDTEHTDGDDPSETPG